MLMQQKEKREKENLEQNNAECIEGGQLTHVLKENGLGAMSGNS